MILEKSSSDSVKGDFTISTDKARLDLSAIHDYLANDSHWGRNISISIVQISIDNSLCFGVYHKNRQVGFARVITDYATFAYIADVFIIPAFRGQQLAKWLMETIINYPQLHGLRRWCLNTRDAHSLYAKYGFRSVSKPESYMEIYCPDIYSK